MATGRIPTTANSPLTAKGDLFTFSTGSAKLAVGSNGDTLVADSAESTGLRWTENYAAGKNKIINGDFYINQRNLTSTTSSGYGFDRWNFLTANGTVTYSAQTFTPGAAPVAGYEGANFSRIVTTGQTLTSAYTIYRQNIEDVRTFAGQTVTISFWAKANSGTPKVAFEFEQNFGTGGSPSAVVLTYGGQVTLSTSWARYSITASVPSISGKTIGTTANTSSYVVNLWVSAGTDFNARTGSIGIQSNTFDIWGVQVEEGSVATAFQTATGTIQGELAACQRYFQREDESQKSIGAGAYYSTTQAWIPYFLKQTMRVAPTVTFDGTGTVTVYDAGSARASTAMATDAISARVVEIKPTTSSTTAGRGVFARISGSGNFINFDAEL